MGGRKQEKERKREKTKESTDISDLIGDTEESLLPNPRIAGRWVLLN